MFFSPRYEVEFDFARDIQRPAAWRIVVGRLHDSAASNHTNEQGLTLLLR
jgi:hypothetical protein